jgi:beta-lactamase regulating signal transducer with metallopeptidase domain
VNDFLHVFGPSALAGQPAVERLAWTLAHFVWQGTAVALLLAVVLRALRRASPDARYAATAAAMAALAVLPVATFVVVDATRVPDRPAPAAARADAASISTSGNRPAWAALDAASGGKPKFDPPASRAPGASAEAAEVAEVAAAAAPSVATPSSALDDEGSLRARAAAWLGRASPWLVAAWALGVAALSVWHAGGLARVWAVRRAGDDAGVGPSWLAALADVRDRLGVRRVVRLLRCPGVDAPAVVGWLRPAILLPVGCLAGLTPGQVEAVLAHELAHVRRHDYLVNLLQAVVETLLFYHPAVWWASARMREEREYCCDDLAVAACGGDRLQYAGALATLEGLRSTPGPLALAAGGRPLLARVRRIVVPTYARMSTGHVARAAAGSAVAGLLLLAAAATWYVREARAADRPAGELAAARAPQTRPTHSTAPAATAPAATAPAGRLVTFTADGSTLVVRDVDSDGDPLELRISTGDDDHDGPATAARRRVVASLWPGADVSFDRGAIVVKPTVGDEARIKASKGLVEVVTVGRSKHMVKATMVRLALPSGATTVVAVEPIGGLVPATKASVIRPGDRLTVTISDLSGPGTESRVTAAIGADGTLALPFVGKANAAGRTPAEFEKDVADLYRDRKVLERAIVTVTPAEPAPPGTRPSAANAVDGVWTMAVAPKAQPATRPTTQPATRPAIGSDLRSAVVGTWTTGRGFVVSLFTFADDGRYAVTALGEAVASGRWELTEGGQLVLRVGNATSVADVLSVSVDRLQLLHRRGEGQDGPPADEVRTYQRVGRDPVEATPTTLPASRPATGPTAATGPREPVPRASDERVAGPRAAAEAFLAAVVAGRDADAAALCDPRSAVPRQIGEFRRLAQGLQGLRLDNMLVADKAAWASTTAVRDDRGQDGALVLGLRRTDDRWLIGDVDFETPDRLADKASRFTMQHRDARVAVPSVAMPAAVGAATRPALVVAGPDAVGTARAFFAALAAGEDAAAYAAGTDEYRKARSLEGFLKGFGRLRAAMDLSRLTVAGASATADRAMAVTTLLPFRDNSQSLAIGLGLVRNGDRWLVRDVDMIRDQASADAFRAGFRAANPDAKDVPAGDLVAPAGPPATRAATDAATGPATPPATAPAVAPADGGPHPVSTARLFAAALAAGEDAAAHALGTAEYQRVHPRDGFVRGMGEMRAAVDLARLTVTRASATADRASAVTAMVPFRDGRRQLAIGLGLVRSGNRWQVRDVDLLRDQAAIDRFMAEFAAANPAAQPLVVDGDPAPAAAPSTAPATSPSTRLPTAPAGGGGAVQRGAASLPSSAAPAPAAATLTPPATLPAAPDPSAMPAADRVAEVYLMEWVHGAPGNPRDAFTPAGPVLADGRGVARFERLPGLRPTDGWQQFAYARVPGRKVGVESRDHWPVYRRSAPSEPFTVTCVDSTTIRGRVTGPAGFLPPDVRIRVLSILIPRPADADDFAMIDLDRAGNKDLWPALFHARPAADGSFAIPDAPAHGSYYLSATAAGLGEAQYRGPNPAAGDNGQQVVLVMRPEGIVTGRVVFRDALDGGPGSRWRPAGAGISVYARTYQNQVVAHPYEAKTGPDGRFSIQGLPAADFTLAVADPPDGRVVAPVERVAVRAGEATTGPVLALEAGVQVQGRVIDRDGGGPVAAASVTAVCPDVGGQAVAHATTAADGTFRMRLPAGPSHLYVDAPPGGYTYPDDDSGRGQSVNLKPGRPVNDVVTLTLKAERPATDPSTRPASAASRPATTLPATTSPAPAPPATRPARASTPAADRAAEVVCLDEAGRPLVGADVYFAEQAVGLPGEPPREPTKAGPVKTDDRGVARFAGLPSLRPTDSWQQAAYALLPGRKAGAAARSGSPDVRAGKPRPRPDERFTVTCGTPTEVRGHVVMPAGHRPQDVELGVGHQLFRTTESEPHPDGGRSRYWDQADWPGPGPIAVAADGAFSIADVPADWQVQVLVRAPGLAGWSYVGPDRDHGESGRDVRVALQPEAVIEGRVVYAAGDGGAARPAGGGIAVMVPGGSASFAPGTLGAATETGPDGRFRLTGLPAGARPLLLFRVPDGWTFAPPRPVDLRAGDVVRDVTLTMDRGIVVTGRVVDRATGAPVAGADVTACSPTPGGEELDSDLTAADGTFRLLVPPGRWSIGVESLPRTGYDVPDDRGECSKVVDVRPGGAAPEPVKLALKAVGPP